MSDIRQWFEELSVGQYADAFEQNDNDHRAPPRLTDQDHKDVGVASLGHGDGTRGKAARHHRAPGYRTLRTAAHAGHQPRRSQHGLLLEGMDLLLAKYGKG